MATPFGVHTLLAFREGPVTERVTAAQSEQAINELLRRARAAA